MRGRLGSLCLLGARRASGTRAGRGKLVRLRSSGTGLRPRCRTWRRIVRPVILTRAPTWRISSSSRSITTPFYIRRRCSRADAHLDGQAFALPVCVTKCNAPAHGTVMLDREDPPHRFEGLAARRTWVQRHRARFPSAHSRFRLGNEIGSRKNIYRTQCVRHLAGLAASTLTHLPCQIAEGGPFADKLYSEQ
jgi:hypothetical protein